MGHFQRCPVTGVCYHGPVSKIEIRFFCNYDICISPRYPHPGHEHIKPTPPNCLCVPQPAPQEQDHRKITGTPRICPRAARTPHCSARGTSSGARHTAVGRESERRLRHVHSRSTRPVARAHVWFGLRTHRARAGVRGVAACGAKADARRPSTPLPSAQPEKDAQFTLLEGETAAAAPAAAPAAECSECTFVSFC